MKSVMQIKSSDTVICFSVLSEIFLKSRLLKHTGSQLEYTLSFRISGNGLDILLRYITHWGGRYDSGLYKLLVKNVANPTINRLACHMKDCYEDFHSSGTDFPLGT